MEVVLGIPFLDLNNADIQFDIESFTCKYYSTAKTLPTARRVELINKYGYTKAALDENFETFIVHVAALKALEPAVHQSRATLLAVL